MKLNIQSLHFTAKEPLNEFVETKLKKLSRHNKSIEAAEVCLRLDKSDVNENKVCEIRLAIPGNDLFAKKHADTFEKAVLETVDALDKQILHLKS